jgi:hypothetical protein
MDERSSKDTPRPRSGNKSANRGKGHKDFNELAFMIAQKATGEIPKEEPSDKNPAAVTLGRLGGLKGGKARAEKLTPAAPFQSRTGSRQTRPPFLSRRFRFAFRYRDPKCAE